MKKLLIATVVMLSACSPAPTVVLRIDCGEFNHKDLQVTINDQVAGTCPLDTMTRHGVVVVSARQDIEDASYYYAEVTEELAENAMKRIKLNFIKKFTEDYYYSRSNDIDGAQSLLDNYPNGKYAAEITEKLMRLVEEKRIEDEKIRMETRKRLIAAEEKTRKEFLDAGFIDNKDGTVTSVSHNLVWQKCSLGQIWNGTTCVGKAKSFSWSEAMALSRNGWRLPSVDELDSLVVCSSGQRKPSERPQGRYVVNTNGHCLGDFSSPTINELIFPNTPSSWFWTASANSGPVAWAILFNKGHSYDPFKTDRLHVRLVQASVKDVNRIPSSEPDLSLDSQSNSPFLEGQNWAGYYTCSHLSEMNLIISAVSETRISAKFYFNNKGTIGSHHVYGEYDSKSRTMILFPGDWIDKPKDFYSVGLKGIVSEDGKSINGSIIDAHFNSCSDFDVKV